MLYMTGCMYAPHRQRRNKLQRLQALQPQTSRALLQHLQSRQHQHHHHHHRCQHPQLQLLLRRHELWRRPLPVVALLPARMQSAWQQMRACSLQALLAVVLAAAFWLQTCSMHCRLVLPLFLMALQQPPQQ